MVIWVAVFQTEIPIKIGSNDLTRVISKLSLIKKADT